MYIRGRVTIQLTVISSCEHYSISDCIREMLRQRERDILRRKREFSWFIVKRKRNEV